MKKSSSFLKRELEKLVDINMASDVIKIDLNKLPKEEFSDEHA